MTQVSLRKKLMHLEYWVKNFKHYSSYWLVVSCPGRQFWKNKIFQDK